MWSRGPDLNRRQSGRHIAKLRFRSLCAWQADFPIPSRYRTTAGSFRPRETRVYQAELPRGRHYQAKCAYISLIRVCIWSVAQQYLSLCHTNLNRSTAFNSGSLCCLHPVGLSCPITRRSIRRNLRLMNQGQYYKSTPICNSGHRQGGRAGIQVMQSDSR